MTSTTEKHPDFDAEKAEAFAEQFLTALNYGSLCLMAPWDTVLVSLMP
jgi:hypothetical protein